MIKSRSTRFFPHFSAPIHCSKPTHSKIHTTFNSPKNDHPIFHLLQRCSTMSHLKQIHAHMITTSLIHEKFAIGKFFFFTVSKSGFVDYASIIFTRTPNPDSFIRNTMIRGFADSSAPHFAPLLFNKIMGEGFFPDKFTFTFLIKSSVRLFSLRLGENLHGFVVKVGLDFDVFVKNSLINMYASCGDIGSARLVFDGSSELDLISWNSMVSSYARMGDMEAARMLFDRMPERNLVSWVVIVAGYVQCFRFKEGLHVLERMKGEGIKPNDAILASVLSACAHLGDLERGTKIHDDIEREGIELTVNLSTALVHMYTKCGRLALARQLFDEMPERNVVSWSALIAGYTQGGYCKEALGLFHEMKLSKIEPNEAILVSLLSALANIGALAQGKLVHSYLERNNIDFSANIGTSLIHMYARCARIEDAYRIFEKLPVRNVDSFNAMISGFGMHGLGNMAISCFFRMEELGIKPNEISFVGILNACSHTGLVDEGERYFGLMKNVYGMAPKIEHYGCIVDLLGRAGYLAKAEDLIQMMPMKPDAVVWAALLSACKVHGDLVLGEKVADRLLEFEPREGAAYVLISNIYAASERWDDVKKVRKLMRDKDIAITPGWSSIEVEGRIHQFLVGDRSHARTNEIYEMLDEIVKKLKLSGHAANISSVLHDLGEEEKEDALHYHSEKLAIAFGLLATGNGTRIYIVKNLRICGDCHAAAKVISRLFSREIIVRDRTRFHHFKDGGCSCKDYW